MTDTNHVVINGAPPISATEGFSILWKLTRALKKAGWRHRASSDGTTKTVSNDPEDDRWASTFGVIGPVTNVGASAAQIAAAANGRALVSGLTGLVTTAYSNDKGRFLIDVTSGTAHQIVKVVDATSCYVDSIDNSVTPGSGKTWEIRDPAQDTYGGHLVGVTAWVCLAGPMVLKMPITAGAAEGVLTSEDVTQEATGARAKVLSVSDDGTYMVLFPRVRGSGAGYFGFDTSVVAGEVSGIEVTPSASLRAMQIEMVFYKRASNENTGGIIGMAGVLPDDDGGMLSDLAASAGCTATKSPGTGGTGNSFPPRGFCLLGASFDSNYATIINSPTDIQGGFIGCVDCIPDQNVEADGSWFMANRKNADYSSGSDLPQVIAFQACFPAAGELCPYISMGPYSSGSVLRGGPNTPSDGGIQPDAGAAWFDLDRDDEAYIDRMSTLTASSTQFGGIRQPCFLYSDVLRLMVMEFGTDSTRYFDLDAVHGNDVYKNRSKHPKWSLRSQGYFTYEVLHVDEDRKFLCVGGPWYIGPWSGEEADVP